MGLRFNPAPGWPPPPPGFVPPPRWQPDPSWPPAPPGWQIWVEDGAPDPRQATGPQPSGARVQARPGEFGSGPAGAPPWGDYGAGPADARQWAGDDFSGPPSGPLTGPPTQAYVPGATGPRDPFGPQDPPGKANGFAVASLVLGIAGITVIGAVLGVIFGVVALRQIRRTGQAGRGLAIAGLVFSIVWLLLLGAFATLWGSRGHAQPLSGGRGPSPSPTARPSSAASHGSLSTNVFALRPGQCFQNPPASQIVLGVTYVTVVPCTTPHNAQAYVQFTATGTSYPGTAVLKRQADSGCRTRIQGNVQTSKITDSMTLHYLYPLAESWASGHRTITCLIVNSKPNLTVSLLRSHPTGH